MFNIGRVLKNNCRKIQKPNGKVCKGHEHVITMRRVNIYKRNTNGSNS